MSFQLFSSFASSADRTTATDMTLHVTVPIALPLGGGEHVVQLPDGVEQALTFGSIGGQWALLKVPAGRVGPLLIDRGGGHSQRFHRQFELSGRRRQSPSSSRLGLRLWAQPAPASRRGLCPVAAGLRRPAQPVRPAVRRLRRLVLRPRLQGNIRHQRLAHLVQARRRPWENPRPARWRIGRGSAENRPRPARSRGSSGGRPRFFRRATSTRRCAWATARFSSMQAGSWSPTRRVMRAC